MKISVIIPTFNEEKVLEQCIESLGDQTHLDFEIIIVDDGSTDKTSEVLRNLQLSMVTLRDKNFQFFQQRHKGAGAARNLGAKHAKGDVMVFVDADMTFDKDFLVRLIEPIENGMANGTFSKEEYVSNWENVWARCWNINEGWENKKRHPRKYPDHQPVFRAILKSEFEKVGGFTPGGYDDDWSLHKKLGYEATHAPGAIFYHKNPSSLGEVFSHSKWVGKRKYKLGTIGDLIGIVRASFPVSLCIGIYKSLVILNFKFLIFKLTYDFGVFVGIFQYLISGDGSK